MSRSWTPEECAFECSNYGTNYSLKEAREAKKKKKKKKIMDTYLG